MQFKLREFSFLGKSLYAVEQRIQRPVFPSKASMIVIQMFAPERLIRM